MKRFLPIALVLVVLSSGCTSIDFSGIPILSSLSSILGGGQVIQYEHDVLVIKSLDAIPSEIDSTQGTKIVAYVQNVGDTKIPQSTSSGDNFKLENMNIEVELYDYCKGLFTPSLPLNGKCKPVSGSSTKCVIDEMVPGEIVPITWSLDPIPGSEVSLRTVCPPDGMKVLVSYPYRTNALTTVTFISKDELERSLEQRENWAVGNYIVSGQGPLKPYITVEDEQPIPVFDGARTVLGLQFKNMGGGYALSDDKNKISYVTDGIRNGDGFSIEDPCAIETSGSGVRIIGDESQKYLCKIGISGLSDEILKRGTRVVSATSFYRYVFTKSVLVTIDPKIVE